jgi:DNA-binding transcriptional regulator YiaG
VLTKNTPEEALHRLALAVQARRELPPPETCRALRLAAGVSLAEVAEAVGVTKQAVLFWELGQRRPTGPRLARYVTVLDALRGQPGMKLGASP